MTRTTSKNPPVCGNDNLSVSTGIRAILPDIMVNYLWELALCGDWQKYEKQSFVLEAGELSGRGIQDIYHVCDGTNSMDKRRVYGVEPVNCRLQVVNSQGSYQMQLCVNQ
ncbi:MAG: hypothetical protein QM683_03305 [Lacrimispora sp.]